MHRGNHDAACYLSRRVSAEAIGNYIDGRREYAKTILI